MATATIPRRQVHRKFVPSAAPWYALLLLVALPVWGFYNAFGFSYVNWVSPMGGAGFRTFVGDLSYAEQVASVLYLAFLCVFSYMLTRPERRAERVIIFALGNLATAVWAVAVLGYHLSVLANVFPPDMWLVKIAAGLVLIMIAGYVFKIQHENFSWWVRLLLIGIFALIGLAPFLEGYLPFENINRTMIVTFIQICMTIALFMAMRWSRIHRWWTGQAGAAVQGPVTVLDDTPDNEGPHHHDTPV